MTSRIWISPPIEVAVTTPVSHKMMRMIAMVVNMWVLLSPVFLSTEPDLSMTIGRTLLERSLVETSVEALIPVFVFSIYLFRQAHHIPIHIICQILILIYIIYYIYIFILILSSWLFPTRHDTIKYTNTQRVSEFHFGSLLSWLMRKPLIVGHIRRKQRYSRVFRHL